MYGKPTPKGSGNGWSGYYKEYYFRSLLELSYLKYLIDNNIEFENAELQKYKIEYIFYGKEKNYFADYFLTNTQELIEIKPKKLLKSQENIAKFKSAINKYGNKFKIITEDDINKLELEEIYLLKNNCSIIFDKRYEEKFDIYYQKNKKGNNND